MLLNNAGVSEGSSLADIPCANPRSQFEVNPSFQELAEFDLTAETPARQAHA